MKQSGNSTLGEKAIGSSATDSSFVSGLQLFRLFRLIVWG